MGWKKENKMESIRRTALVSALKKHFESADGVASYDVALTDCLKANQHYTALRITPTGEKVGVSLDVSPYEKMLEDGKTLDEVIEKITETVRVAFKHAPTNGLDLDSLNDYDTMKDKLVLSLIGVKGNEAFLAGIPHKVVGTDLALYARFLIKDDETGCSSVVVSNEMLNGRSAEDVLNDAIITSPKNRPVKVKSLFGMVKELVPVPFEDPDPTAEEDILVVTSEVMSGGAGVIFYPGMFERLSCMLGGSFYILPSSRHEVLAVKKSAADSPDMLLDLVCSVNATEVIAADFLADSVYYYDAENKEFRRVATKSEHLAEAV
jgi:hypothetical protein